MMLIKARILNSQDGLAHVGRDLLQRDPGPVLLIEDIAAGTGRSIARRIINMGRSAQITYAEPIVFSGGVANNEAITDIFSELLGKKVTAVSMPQSTAALGAALRARKMWEAEQAKQ